MAVGRLIRQVCTSASAAVRPALLVLMVTALTLPFQALINAILVSKATTDWKLALVVGAVVASIWYIAAFLSTLFDLRTQDRIEVAMAPSFPATSFLIGLYGVTTILSLALINGLHAEGDPIWMQLLPLVFVVIAFYAWPRTIHCGALSVWQRNLWGRKKDIPYREIQAISVSANGTTTVLGLEETIEHTQQHVGAESFRHLVASRCARPVY